MEPHIYNVTINWSNARKGIMCSPEISEASPTTKNCVEVATPPEFEKGIPGIWSPEHLFTASVSSCLLTTFLAIADYSKLEFSDFTCSSKGKLEKIDNQMVMSEIILEPTVTINDESKRDKALRVIEKAEKACLISNSIKSKVILRPNIRVIEPIVQ